MQLKMLYSSPGNTSMEDNYPNQNVPLRMTGQEREPEAVNKSKRSPMPKLWCRWTQFALISLGNTSIGNHGQGVDSRIFSSEELMSLVLSLQKSEYALTLCS